MQLPKWIDFFFFETGIGVITLMLHFSLDLKQLPSPYPPKPREKKCVPTEVTLSKPAVGHICRTQSRVMSGLSTKLLTAVVGQPIRNRVNLEFLLKRDLSVY